ncbi:MAG: DNA polymerase I, partial [Candidatus Berkelbacteria bacterium Licking1014_85]
TVLNFKKGLKDGEIIDEEKLKSIYVFAPINMIDFKALCGDSSDNIPGVAGIGEKTALKLIQEYTTVENIYANVDTIALAKSVVHKLHLQKAMAELSKKLATIKTDLTLKFDIASAKLHDFDEAKVVKEFEKLGFQSLIKRLPKSTRMATENQKLF